MRSGVTWPETPVENSRAFAPRHCPWPECPDHLPRSTPYRFRLHAEYADKRGRRVTRFRCSRCARTFSRKTFATSYYLKRPELLIPVAAGLVAGSAHRQIARTLGCAPSTVTRLSARLGRHAMLLQALALDALRSGVREAFASDHFETFEFSQDLPLGVWTAAGRESWFVYGVDPAPHARTGRRTPAQEQRIRRRPRRATRGGYEGSFLRGLDVLLPLVPSGQPLRLACDGKEDYPRAVCRHHESARVRLEIHPNPRRGPKGSPRSSEALARDGALFAVDQLHALLRHSIANHKRETIAFGRRLNAIMERLFLALVWRNLVKGRSERRPDRTTPAMHLGLADTPWTWRRVLSRRLFVSHASLPPVWMEIYRRDWLTPVLPANTRHRLRHAA